MFGTMLSKTVTHGCIQWRMPSRWCIEDGGDCLSLYDPDGSGALTLSFLSFADPADKNSTKAEQPTAERLTAVAEQFLRGNGLRCTETPTPRVDGRRGAFISCLAADADGQSVYLWLTACGPRAVLATYFGDSDREAAVCEKIVRSMRPI